MLKECFKNHPLGFIATAILLGILLFDIGQGLMFLGLWLLAWL
jgi:hypothetical protein